MSDPMTPEELEAFAAAAPECERSPLWVLLDWSLWGAGMGDTFREPLASTMVAAVPSEARVHAELIMAEWLKLRGVDSPSRTNAELRAENARLNTENERIRSMTKLHRESVARQRHKLEQKLIGWREAAEEARAELDKVIREAAADKAKLDAKVADLEAQIEAGRRVEKGEPCPECGGTVSPWRDVWGKVGFHACTTCTWPLPGPDGTPRIAPEMPRPPAEEAQGEYRCPWCTSDRWTSVTVEGRAMAQCVLCEAIHTDLGLIHAPEMTHPATQERAGDTDTSPAGSGRGTGVTETQGAQADLSLIPADLITSDPGIRGGEPCIDGTRIPASEVAGYLADGATWDEVREMLPSLPSLPFPSTERTTT